jgi:hypothetical protein
MFRILDRRDCDFVRITLYGAEGVTRIQAGSLISALSAADAGRIFLVRAEDSIEKSLFMKSVAVKVRRRQMLISEFLSSWLKFSHMVV